MTCHSSLPFFTSLKHFDCISEKERNIVVQDLFNYFCQSLGTTAPNDFVLLSFVPEGGGGAAWGSGAAGGRPGGGSKGLRDIAPHPTFWKAIDIPE